MGYIASSSTKTFYAYLTQEGRRIFLSEPQNFKIEFFSLHDNDVNYQITSKILNDLDYNKLRKGFMPDITGDIDDCIRSISQATRVDEKSYLKFEGIVRTPIAPPVAPPPNTNTE